MSILKVPELEIPSGDPFKNDELGRKKIADHLTLLLFNTYTPFVLAINSSWGTGKTTFLRMWEQKLTNEQYHCFIYNAWENDFVEDPFISFMGEIDKNISTFSQTVTDEERKKN